MLMKDSYSKWQSANNSIYADFITVNATSFHWKIFCFFFCWGCLVVVQEKEFRLAVQLKHFNLLFITLQSPPTLNWIDCRVYMQNYTYHVFPSHMNNWIVTLHMFSSHNIIHNFFKGKLQKRGKKFCII